MVTLPRKGWRDRTRGETLYYLAMLVLEGADIEALQRQWHLSDVEVSAILTMAD